MADLRTTAGSGHDVGPAMRLAALTTERRARILKGGIVMKRSPCGQRFVLAEGQSDSDLRDVIREALKKAVVGFLGIEVVYPDDSVVIYAMAVNDGSPVVMQRRGYAQDASGAVTLAAEVEEVKAVTTWEPSSTAKPPATTPPKPPATPPPAAAAEGIPPPPDLASRIQAARSPTTTPRAVLDYSGLGMSRPPVGDETIDPAPDMTARIRAARGIE